MISNCGAGEDPWEALGQQGDQTSWSERKSTLDIHWKDWCWSSNTLDTRCKELTHCKRPRCWERLDDRRGDGWMASRIQWIWTWANSGNGEGLGSLECYNPWGCEESDTTWHLNYHSMVHSGLAVITELPSFLEIIGENLFPFPLELQRSLVFLAY